MYHVEPSAMGIAIPASLSERPQLFPHSLHVSKPAPHTALQTIVVMLDGSAAAEHALPYALAVARKSGAALRLVRVYSRLDDIDPWQFSQAASRIKPSREQKQNYLAELARKIRRLEGLHADTILIDSPDTVEALVSGAAGADLVVVGSRRRRWLPRLGWFSIADQLRRRLSAPLLLTPGHSRPVSLATLPRLQKVLVPLDGSVLAQRVLEPAAGLARVSGGSLTLLNVQNPLWSRGLFEHTDPRGHLLATMQQPPLSSLPVAGEILTTSSDPAKAISAYAADGDVDLIAIATLGDSGLSRLLRGSVADYLLRTSKLPILLQNVPEAEQRPAITSVG